MSVTASSGHEFASSIACVSGQGDLAGLDAIALVPGSPGPPTLYVGGPDGAIRSIDQSSAPAMIASVVTLGTRIDALAVGDDGCLYATLSMAVDKFTLGSGSCP